MWHVAILCMLNALSGPRPFGYFIGDEILLEAEVAWGQGFVLEGASLPHPGPVTYWLELKSVETREIDPGRYHFRFHYQTFYAPLGAQGLDVPGFTLVATHAEQRVEKSLLGWHFLMSPLRDVGPRSSEDAVALRADVAPNLASMARPLVGGITCVIVAVSSLFALAFRRAWGPFRRRAGRPFAQAAHSLRHQPPSVEGYLSGLLSLHRAFDVTAGRRVLSEDVSDVLRALPRFAGAADDIRLFFDASRRAFFGEDPRAAMVHLSPAQLAALSAKLAAVEREAS